MLKQPIFWLMYFMFVIVGAGGLMVTANLKPIAADLKIDAISVTLVGLTMTTVTFAATIDRILNGLTRPLFGWISDKIGRENTMFIAFGMEGIGIYLLYLWGHDPVWFVILSGFVFFAWGEIYSLFPSTCTDTFGSKFAATNAGLLYTAKGTAALLVPFANTLQRSRGRGTRCSSSLRPRTSWHHSSPLRFSSPGGRAWCARPADLAAGLNVRPGGNIHDARRDKSSAGRSALGKRNGAEEEAVGSVTDGQDPVVAVLPEGLTIGVDAQRAFSRTRQRMRPRLCRLGMLDVSRMPHCVPTGAPRMSPSGSILLGSYNGWSGKPPTCA